MNAYDGTALIPVHCCCNGDHGEIARLVKLDWCGALEIDTIQMEGIAFRETPGCIRTLRREWPVAYRRYHVGNIYWNLYWLLPTHAVDLLQRARASRLFTLDGGWDELFRWFESGVQDGAWLTAKLVEAAKEHRL